MKLITEKTEKSYAIRGTACDVVSHIEDDSMDMSNLVTGALLAMVANKEKEVIVDFESSEEIDNRPFEVVIHQDQKGDAAKFEFRFLDEEESHG